MTRQLLSLSKPQEVKMVPSDLCTSLQNVINICQGTLDKSVLLAVDVPFEHAPANADPVQIEQVLLNLCVNAAHSLTIMRQPSDAWGGRVRISLGRVNADSELLTQHPGARGVDYWEVTISDTGVGMDEKTLSNVFTPFFTTKQKGAGSGLGLSMAYSIISQHGGFMTVRSVPGSGSTFSLYLPVLDGELAEVVAVAPVDIPGGTGTILVVDDEEALRDNATEILEYCGYRVLNARDGEEALRLVGAHGEEIGLVLLDMVMPVLSGKETFYRIREMRPGIKILLSSGNSHDERVEELLGAGVDGFIGKPYTLAELSQAVHDHLHQDKRQ
jgi:CheY-like chemotaxis protein